MIRIKSCFQDYSKPGDQTVNKLEIFEFISELMKRIVYKVGDDASSVKIGDGQDFNTGVIWYHADFERPYDCMNVIVSYGQYGDPNALNIHSSQIRSGPIKLDVRSPNFFKSFESAIDKILKDNYESTSERVIQIRGS